MMPRRCDVIRLAASTSFTADEVRALDHLVRALLSGKRLSGPMRLSPTVASLARKVATMKGAIARQKARRAGVAREIGEPDPNRPEGT